MPSILCTNARSPVAHLVRASDRNLEDQGSNPGWISMSFLASEARCYIDHFKNCSYLFSLSLGSRPSLSNLLILHVPGPKKIKIVETATAKWKRLALELMSVMSPLLPAFQKELYTSFLPLQPLLVRCTTSSFPKSLLHQ